MGEDTQAHCPECGTVADVQLVNEEGNRATPLKASNEEILLEIVCDSDSCNNVWRAVYAFVGNQ